MFDCFSTDSVSTSNFVKNNVEKNPGAYLATPSGSGIGNASVSSVKESSKNNNINLNLPKIRNKKKRSITPHHPCRG